MRKFVGNSLFVGAAAAGAIALSASAAFAAPWTVTNSNGNGAFTATSTNVKFVDVTTNQTFTCSNSSISGTALAGTNRPDDVATGLNGTFTNCKGPLGSTGSAVLNTGTLNAKSYDSGTDTVSGNITDITATLTITSVLGTCTGQVGGTGGNPTGSIGTAGNTIKYANGTGTLTIPADPAPQQLGILSASGVCLSLINGGDSVTFEATYTVTNPSPPITVRPT